MRSAAQIRKIALAVQRNDFAFRQIINDFGFVMFAFVREKLDSFITRHNHALQLFVAFDDFMHFLFDFCKIISGKRLFARKVIIKAVFNSRADGNLNVRPQFFDGLSHNVRAGVAQNVQALFILTGDDSHGCVGSDGSA